ncbi:MAG TPA: hydrogenase maturation nickel metallochaperone HypA [Anaerolineales bacterium]|nr:hydrogenase maturation nickel metallochaperone HypA [Anaerolineales bacterium]
MHELSVTQSILDLALKHASKANASQITDIRVVMGALSTNVDDSVQFYWDIIAKGTLAEGAKLHFRRVPAEFQCMDCSQKYHPADAELICPCCESTRVRIIAGEEFYLDSIDIEKQIEK